MQLFSIILIILVLSIILKCKVFPACLLVQPCAFPWLVVAFFLAPMSVFGLVSPVLRRSESFSSQMKQHHYYYLLLLLTSTLTLFNASRYCALSNYTLFNKLASFQHSLNQI